MARTKEEIIESLKHLAQQILPPGAKLILFGSQARGDAREDSDWDLLVLLDKSDDNFRERFDKYAYPIVSLGWQMGEYFSPKIYTADEWDSRRVTPFYKNVSQEGVVLC